MTGLCRLALAGAVALAGCAPLASTATCTAPLKPAVQVDLYFGRGMPGGGEVGEAAWSAFLGEAVTPRFPDGLSVLDVAGQHRAPDGTIDRERSKLLVIVVFDAPAHRARVDEIVDLYAARFGQRGVFRSERAVCAGL